MPSLKIECSDLKNLRAVEWDEFVHKQSAGLIYYSAPWLSVCADLAGDVYVIQVRRNTSLVGGMPFTVLSSELGCILNSSPVVGSHGGPLISTEEDISELSAMIWERFFAEASIRQALSSTAITNPLTPLSMPSQREGRIVRSERIGMMLRLEGMNREDELFAAMHPKTRNAVRKSLKGNFVIREDASDEGFETMENLHRSNAERLGITPKSDSFFKSLRRHFKTSNNLRLTILEMEGRGIAALLMLYFNGVAEYFVPAIDDDYRNLQPLSALIHEALLNALKRRCRWWNWGGSPPNNASLLRFKSRWGSIPFPYRYETLLTKESEILHTSKPSDLVAAFPHGFALPFSELRNQTEDGPLKNRPDTISESDRG